MRGALLVGAFLIGALSLSASFDSGLRALAPAFAKATAGEQGKQEAATLSFSEREGATFVATLRARQKIEVDLSALGPKVTIYRAVLRPGRDETEAFSHRNVPVKIAASGSDDPLPLLPPRFSSFDATEVVRKSLETGSSKVAFNVVGLPAYRPASTRLDITCSAKAKNAIPRVTGLTVRHQAGQTILTWKEIDPTIREETIAFRDFKQWRDQRVGDAPRIRYRIYRSAEPLSAATIGRAGLVDEVGPLTGWDPDFYGNAPKDDARVPRYAVEDGKPPVEPGTGVYAHNPGQAGKAYYAVSVAIHGEEDLSTFDAGNSTKEAVEESVGLGEPILQRVVKPVSFSYVEGPALHYYVRWESPPNANLPSRPYDYLVAVPPKNVDLSPVGLHLHCWGGSLEGGYGWWYNAGQGAVLIATNQIPYDWWTGYHEHSGTWKSWSEGVVRDYTQTRVISFLDWAATKWKLDLKRVFTAGNSMGGSGSPNLGIRRADRVAWVVSWVGVHTPARSPQFKGSYERVYGALEWKLPFQDGKTPAFDFFDDAAFVRRNPAAETPLICFANGKNDGAIGWPQARDFWKALQDARQPHVFVWGQAGHGQRAMLPGPSPGERELGMEVRLDRTLPAFTNCSLDRNPGNGDPKDGDPEGQSNLYLYWDSGADAAVDEADRWSMALRLSTRAAAPECAVDVTPRRCQKFKPPAGAKLSWCVAAVADGKELQRGEVAADPSGLVTVPKVAVTKGGSRLTLQVTK